MSPIVSASDRIPLASGLGPSTFIFRALSSRVSFPGPRRAYPRTRTLGVARRRRAKRPWTAFVLPDLAETSRQTNVISSRQQGSTCFASTFFLLEIICSMHQLLLLLLRSQLVAELRSLFDLSALRSLPLSFCRLLSMAGRLCAPLCISSSGYVRVGYFSASSSRIYTTQNSSS